MTVDSPLSNSLLLRIWAIGSTALPSALRGLDSLAERTALRQLLDEGWLKSTVRPGLECPGCRFPYEIVEQDSVLVCPKCGSILDTRIKFDPEMHAYHPVFSKLGAAVETALADGNICRTRSRQSSHAIEGIEDLGEFSTLDGSELRVFLTRGALGRRPLRELWALCLERGYTAVVVCPEVSEPVSQLLRTVVGSIPILSVSSNSLSSPAVLAQVGDFPRFLGELRARINAFAQVLGRDSDSSSHVSPVLPEDIESLARSGGRAFEAPGLRLLMPIGVAEHINKPGYLPDGLLLLPDGFWIVDTKSSEEGFRFDVSERDKAFRYLSTVQEEYKAPMNGWGFYGEIVLTRTDPMALSDLRAARDYFVSQKTRSTVVVLSFEGMKELFERAWKGPEYWHRFDVAKDPTRLLLLTDVARGWKGTGPTELEFSTGPLRFVSSAAVRSYWDYVIERGEYPQMNDRTPGQLSIKLQRLFSEKYARGRPPPKKP